MAQTYTPNLFTLSDVVSVNLTEANANWEALKSSFSGPSTPPDPVPGMWWFDTTSNILKLRNETNSAWQSIWNFANNKPVITNLSNEITLDMMSPETKSPSGGIEGFRKLGTTSTDACAGNDSRLWETRVMFPGESIIGRNDVECTKTDDDDYTLIKAFTIPIPGSYRIKFGLWGYGSRPGYAKIYRNYSALSGEASQNGNTPVIKTFDLAGWSIGDLCQIYYKTDASSVGQVHINNFRIFVSVPIIGAAASAIS